MLIEEWWGEPGQGDQSMEDEHHEFWDDVLANAIDTNLTGKKLLDFGCNQGGMLRHIYKTYPFREAVGIDLAIKSVEEADRRKGDLPITYKTCEDLDTLDSDFDCATSTAVIYLIKDIAAHAQGMFRRLKPGGIYYATHPDYVAEPRFHMAMDEIDKYGAIKCSRNTLDDILKAFEDAGFKVYVQRMLPKGYIEVPISAKSRWYGTGSNEIEFWYNHRYAFRCVKPVKS